VKKLLLGLMVTSLIFVGCGKVEQKAQYNYINAEDTAKLIRKDSSKLVLVDIQEKEDFAEEHLKGAVETYAYPVKTDKERERLNVLVPIIKNDQKVIIICPRGGGGADRAYDFFIKKGINKENLYTLIDGQYGWPRNKISDVLVQE